MIVASFERILVSKIQSGAISCRTRFRIAEMLREGTRHAPLRRLAIGRNARPASKDSKRMSSYAITMVRSLDSGSALVQLVVHWSQSMIYFFIPGLKAPLNGCLHMESRSRDDGSNRCSVHQPTSTDLEGVQCLRKILGRLTVNWYQSTRPFSRILVQEPDMRYLSAQCLCVLTVITDCVGHNPSPVSGFPNKKFGVEQLVSCTGTWCISNPGRKRRPFRSQFWQRPRISLETNLILRTPLMDLTRSSAEPNAVFKA